MKRAWYVLRSALLWFVSLLHVAIAVPALIALAIFLDPKKHDWLQRTFCRSIIFFAGAKIKVIRSPGFDPQKTWPVLISLATRDGRRQNRDDLIEFYRRAGLAEDWVLLAGDGPQPARNDTVGWRAAMTMAAIDALHQSFTASRKWPITCAGFSGGAKSAGFIAPLLAKNGCRIAGIYLTGMNEEHLAEGYAKFQPGADFLTTPIFVAIGRDDRIATQEQQYAVISSIKRTGFSQIRIATFHGAHEVNDAQTAIALRWFRSLQK